MPKIHGEWQSSKGIARAILHDRAERRKILGWMLMIALLMMAAGLWLIDGWLGGSPWRFLIWWAACATVTATVMIFALYDALAVIREERARAGRPRDE